MDPVVRAMIEEVRQAVVDKGGDNLRLLVLYGSEARGEATDESDVDLLAVLEAVDEQVESDLDDAVYEVMWQHNFPRLFSLQVMSARDYESQREKGFSFIRNVEREGRVLWRAA